MAAIVDQIAFLGASVSQFSIQVGWNDNASTLSVILANDIGKAGFDDFSKPEPGSPVLFSVGDNFSFNGIVQKWTQKHSSSTNPVFEVNIVDPRPVLAGVQVILANYQGTSFGLPNIINAFGNLERIQFGLSGANDNGMPYNLVKREVEAFTVLYTNSQYKIDLRKLPVPPNDFRITGNVISVLDLITQTCDAGGCDFIVDLLAPDANGIYTIRPRTISRNTSSPPANQKILEFVNAHTDEKSDYSFGRELRAEPSTKLLIGGIVNEIWQARQLLPFWGFDSDGNPVTTTINNGNFAVDVRQLGIGMLGKNYKLNVNEVRAALGSQETWETYMYAYKRGLANQMGIIPAQDFKALILVGQQGGSGTILDGHNFAAPSLGKRGDRLADPNDTIEATIEKLYQFVNAVGQEYYGKQFVARLPFVARKIDANTNQTITSLEPTNAGWKETGFFGQGSLGISNFNEHIFTVPDGRLTAFVRFDIFNEVDTSHLSPENAAFESNRLFVKCSVDPTIIRVKGVSAVIVKLGDPIIERASIAPHLAGLDALARAGAEFNGISYDLQIATMKAALLDGSRSEGLTLPGAQRPLIPSMAAIPLQDNRSVYGPWFAHQNGVFGQVVIEQDESLTPWNFGNRATLELAALARLRNASAGQQVTEAGHVTLAGLPQFNVGDTLVAGGPNLSNIQVSIGNNGVTTTYRMQTFTKRFGDFGRLNDERLKRIGNKMNVFEASIRRAFGSAPAAPFVPARAIAFEIMKNKGHKGQRETHSHSHDMIEVTHPETGKSHRVGSNSLTFHVHRLATEDTKKTKNIASASKNANKRGFSTKPGGDVDSGLPCYVEPGTGAETPTVEDLTPYKDGHDMQVSYGDTYKDIRVTDVSKGYEPNNARPVGMRFPMVGVGWGFDVDGKPIPNKSSTYPSSPSDEFKDNYLTNTKDWKAGPVDIRWNEERGVWVAGGGDSVTVAVVIQHSGHFGNGVASTNLPKYICRPASLSSVSDHPRLTFDTAASKPPLSSGTSDSIVFNLQEALGDVHIINVGTPVLLYKKSGLTFMSEHPRTLIRRSVTMPTQFAS